MYVLSNHPDFPAGYGPTQHQTLVQAKSHAEVVTALNRSGCKSHVEWEVRLEGYSDEYVAGWTIQKLTPEWVIINEINL